MVNRKTKINALNYANEMLNDVNKQLTQMGMDKLDIKVNIPENDKKQKTPRKKQQKVDVVQLVQPVENDKPKKRGRPKKTIVEDI